jgi:dTDP-4-dehydrorhamnose reductase
VTPYGAAKAAAETAVRVVDPAAVIARTSLIMGDADSKQVRFCLDLLTGAAAGAFFSDEYRCPIDVSDLAAALLELAGSGYAGLINIAGPDTVSRVELGQLVAKRYDLDASAIPVTTLAEAGVVRPAEVRLDISRAQSTLHTTLRGVHELLAP